MSDEIWRRDEVESPCIKVCSIHPATRICVGCYRTIQEIGTWSVMSAEERRAVMTELPGRASLVSRRRGGRRARTGGGVSGGEQGAADAPNNGVPARGLPPKL